MKSLLPIGLAAIILASCVTDDNISELLPNTENSMMITGVRESISYTYSSKSGRTETSVPEDINMIQILVLDQNDQIVYEQYHYNYNAYNDYYYDSAAHDGDDYMFENTLPDTLYIPSLADGTYTVLATTAYAHSYGYHYSDSVNDNYPIVDSYESFNNPIFVGKAVAEVSQETDALVTLNMKNISARIDLNIISSPSNDWSLEMQFESSNATFYSFENESLMTAGSDNYEYLYMWRDGYWNQTSYYFLPRDLSNVDLSLFNHSTGLNVNISTPIDPSLTMGVGDVFTLNLDMQQLLEQGEGGEATLSWEDIEWNSVGGVNIP